MGTWGIISLSDLQIFQCFVVGTLSSCSLPAVLITPVFYPSRPGSPSCDFWAKR